MIIILRDNFSFSENLPFGVEDSSPLSGSWSGSASAGLALAMCDLNSYRSEGATRGENVETHAADAVLRS